MTGTPKIANISPNKIVLPYPIPLPKACLLILNCNRLVCRRTKAHGVNLFLIFVFTLCHMRLPRISLGFTTTFTAPPILSRNVLNPASISVKGKE